ncbi:putative methyltransferase-domain-containing protein [Gongronella butleri]|nr:putative methyltransferase-domain-containing protein [Gongronella butleri]
MGRRTSVSDEDKPIMSVEGWEDGVHYVKHLAKLDRWELQAADKLTVHVGDQDIVLLQDPHSNHLGGYIWLSSVVFCSYMDALAKIPKKRNDRQEWIHLDHDKLWVELGSGVGLIGIMLAKLGIERVVITDIDELVPAMERNVEANALASWSISGRKANEDATAASWKGSVTVEPLLWNDDVAIKHIKSLGQIDYIVACDCIYSEASAVDLVATMDKLATNDTVIICLSEVRNQAAQDTFLEQARAIFHVDLVPQPQWQKKILGVEFEETLNLYRLSRTPLNQGKHHKKRRDSQK